MDSYSNFIVESMNYVDQQILTINPNSIDRLRLHNNTHRAIVSSVHKVMAMESSTRMQYITYIYKTQLVAEMCQSMKEQLL